MRKPSIVILLSIITFLQSEIPSRATSGTPTWALSLVATPAANQYVSTPDLAFDHYGTPSTSFSLINTTGSNSVQHAQHTSLGLWSSRELATGVGVGIRTAIAFDRSERPSIAWVNTTEAVQGQFNYGTNGSVGTAANATRPIINMNYDLAGNLRGMYGGSSSGDFSSISYNGTTYSSAAMASIPGVNIVYDAQMTVDNRGLRQIAARTNLTGGGQALALLSEPAGGPWATSNLALADFVDGASIATNPLDGSLAVAYSTYNASTNTSKLIYTKFSGNSSTTTEILSFNTFRYQDVSLAFDRSDGRPAIAFERRVNSNSAQELWYAWLNASSVWQTSLVDSTISMDAPEGSMPRGPSLAFDDYGTSWPAIAYVDSNGALNTAFDPPAPEPAFLPLLLVLSASIIRRRR